MLKAAGRTKEIVSLGDFQEMTGAMSFKN